MSQNKNKVLLIWPETDKGYYDFNPLSNVFGSKGLFFPLSLIYVAAELGNNWDYTLIDDGTKPITQDLCEENDFFLISVNILQRFSAERIIQFLRPFKKPIIIGGPLISTLEHVFENEPIIKVIGEIESYALADSKTTKTLGQVLSNDMEQGTLKNIYRANGHPDIKKTNLPRYDLVNPKEYFNLSIQTSRGCHHYCDFCQEIPLYGTFQRKNIPQIIQELDLLLKLGEKKTVYIVDDNFMGNINNPDKKNEFKNLLMGIRDWQIENNYPFDFLSQCSLEVTDHVDILELMTKIGLNMMFLGVESVDDDLLSSVHKNQNLRKNMADKIRTLQDYGMGIFAGLIIGFDGETDVSVDHQIQFVKESLIPISGMSILLGFPGTKLYTRMLKENRISKDGDSLSKSFRSNIILKMHPIKLYNNYLRFTKSIYNSKEYFSRCVKWIDRWNDSYVIPGKKGSLPANLFIKRVFRSILFQGILSKYQLDFWKYIIMIVFKFHSNYHKFALALYLGYFYQVAFDTMKKLEAFVDNLPPEILREWDSFYLNKS
ncbi:MAG: radical SAM protein [Chitinivibrionales bacterium]|nr:radical SAM protein [Chitinivibrionales bacterium]